MYGLSNFRFILGLEHDIVVIPCCSIRLGKTHWTPDTRFHIWHWTCSEM